MDSIQVQLMSGAGAGRRTTYADSPITFGRDVNNTVVVEDEFASRQHGEIRFENDQWVLANLSDNGTRLNRKLIKDKPAVIKSGDTISIGKTPVFNLTVLGGMEAATSEVPEEIDDEQTQAAKKRKLWISIGVYLAVIIALGLFLKFNMGDKKKDVAKIPPMLTDDDIAEEIRGGLVLDESQIKAKQRAIAADKLYPHRHENLKTLYRAHHLYQEALAHSKKSVFDEPQTQLNFQAVRDELIRAVKKKYKSAYTKLGQNDYRSAAREFREIIEFYEDRDSKLIKNVERLLHFTTMESGRAGR